ncbi:hypothetical protein HYV49_00720 [Candidatus Pacearchaeota archaeon]|nr:hypothetical protein [Candidatus Pacearchaeota archaeon]
MRIEIDQSGKIESYINTIIAFRNGEQFSVLLDRKTKNEIITNYRGKYKDIIYRLFAICIFYCIKTYLDKTQKIIIDIEYKGREKDIKKHLLRFIWRVKPNFNKDIIQFDIIGKKSRAHRLAYQTFIGKLAPNRILTKKEVEELL